MVQAGERAATRPWRMTAEAMALWEKFPPRPSAEAWPATCQDRHVVVRLLHDPVYAMSDPRRGYERKLAVLKILDWLEGYPGASWQERWKAAGVQADGRADWRAKLAEDLSAAGRLPSKSGAGMRSLGTGLGQLFSADVLRPAYGWLLRTSSPHHLAAEMARSRDPEAFAALRAAGAAGTVGIGTMGRALERIAMITAAKGGMVGEITVGDCLEVLVACHAVFADPHATHHSPFFYQLLHTVGALPPQAPKTVRMFSTLFPGQATVEGLVDRYDLACRPVRDLIVDYLRERQPSVDYSTLKGLAKELALWFWKDLELHHPGIDSLRLHPDVAAAWKARLRTRTVRTTTADGQVSQTTVARDTAPDVLIGIRAFYLDIAQWALEDPARWGPWAATCPIRDQDIGHKKALTRRKARMDQRTRERIPHLSTLVGALDQARQDAAQRLRAATATPAGHLFTAAGRTWRRTTLRRASARIWIEDPATGRRHDAILEEEHAFWAWAAVEVLRATGIRIEELCELSHHSLVQYRLPDTGELIPLLQIAPSKTDEERLLVVSPELADVLSAVICRIRGNDGAVPLVAAYDIYEREWISPMPLLFQRTVGIEYRPIPIGNIRTWLHEAITLAGVSDQTGMPMAFTPHDFRRIFATEAIMTGMPPHIAQLILGHKDINTTMGYKAVYPAEAINGHRAFIARRRSLRPSEEYRTPTDTEWQQFLGHFQHRKVALGDCGRAYATACIHEHSCIRCPLLRPDPAQRPRLLQIRDNLIARIAEAKREGWGGEAEGLTVSLSAANAKLTQLDTITTRRETSVHLGIPAFPDLAGRHITASPHPRQEDPA